MAWGFLTISALLIMYTIVLQGAFVLLWPAASFALVGISYLTTTTKCFGKKENGHLHWISQFILLPYLVCLWSLWHIIRFFQKENPYDTLNNQITIGRRLFFREMPSDTQVVVDLTCEFNEDKRIVANYEYKCFPILDCCPTQQQPLIDFIKDLALCDKKIYIHCAQGHGRTSMITCVLLVFQEKVSSPQQAMEQIQQKRPRANMTRRQWQLVENCCCSIAID
ncbi:dual specificity protein phosphatase family protein [Candidatus Uabimicrobium amorphum]|uniref:Tyrosine specific protein phosphatases domain-containing protein n=1 Tax=Uabimicrobium amorphum TaxID=2596890 RepID=A0A5S9IPP0_UABAM|nr:dual specificity protein phosphatase family protein [Candidatus Uabimicrobium amorphum]BBM85798.1 hypothetical protein UABAM_04176 [Candidatus Uabimicrobium amorphum]